MNNRPDGWDADPNRSDDLAYLRAAFKPHDLANKPRSSMSYSAIAPNDQRRRHQQRARQPAASRPHRRKLLAPLMVAAVLTITTITGTYFFNRARNDQAIPASAGVLVVGDGMASLDGVQFPVPAGWTALPVAADARWAGVCVAPTPSNSTCDGIELRIALARNDGSTTPLQPSDQWTISRDERRSPVITGETASIGGRPGTKYNYTLHNPDQSATEWSTSDLALDVTVTGTALLDHAAKFVAGIDLARWTHPQGPPVAQSTSTTPTR